MKKAVITGITGQLGPVWKETLLELGFDVYGLGLPECDVSDMNQIYDNKFHFSPDVLVLNAAIDNPPGSNASFHGNLERIIQVNLIGAANVVQVYLPDMIENGGGVIVGIGSIMGFVGADYRNYSDGWQKPVGYNLSKAALMHYMKCLAVQYGKYNIRACGVAFGPYDGGKLNQEFLGKFLKNVPSGKPISKDACKAALRFAVECDGFNGQVSLIDGGYTAW